MKSDGNGKEGNWQIYWGIALIFLSAVCYFCHYLLFKDVHHIFIYLVGDIAFVFLEVLLVSLVIHQILEQREKQARLNKLNVVIGVFFSEIGNLLIQRISELDLNQNDGRDKLQIRLDWSSTDFKNARQWLETHDFKTSLDGSQCQQLCELLLSKRSLLLALMENPNLLEHESFTDMLRAVFHLTEELEVRPSLDKLPPTDYKHLTGDIKRVYSLLLPQWIDYMAHLQKEYPYLFSLAVRTNPFNIDTSPVVKQ